MRATVAASPITKSSPGVLEDNDLIAKFQAEETRNFAFNQIVRKYQVKIYGIIRKMVIDHDDADDLTQEVFVKVWNHLHDFRGDAQLFTWLYRVATNECLNFLKKKRRKYWLPIHNVEAELSQLLDDQPYITSDDMQLKLQKAILTLPEKQRLVFNMKYFEEMPYQEMSEILGTSVGALKASYHIAVKKIEAYIQQHIDDKA